MHLKNSITSAVIWLLRALEFAFAVILLASTGYLARQTRHTDAIAGRRLIVPLVISAIAIVEILAYLLTLFIRSWPVFAFFSFLDFCIWVVYLTSAGLLRKNFNGPPLDNDLAPYLINARRRAGLNSHSGRIQNLVRLTSGLVIIQIIFFFFTMLLKAYRAYLAKKTSHVDNEKMGFDRMRNGSDENRVEVAAAPAATVPASTTMNTATTAPTVPAATATSPVQGVGRQHVPQETLAPHTAGGPGGATLYHETEQTTSTTVPSGVREQYV